jgi:hypothetical protein
LKGVQGDGQGGRLRGRGRGNAMYQDKSRLRIMEVMMVVRDDVVIASNVIDGVVYWNDVFRWIGRNVM